ncbi:MAG: acyltransferase [Opitutaceae bacterium]
MSHWLGPRLQPPTGATPLPRDLALEGARGVCAGLVLFAHLFLWIPYLDPVWAPSPRLSWISLGLPAVLFFFVLSGYVIGLVTTGPATGAAIRNYLRHRAGRLIPLNTLAVGLSALLLVHPVWKAVMGNLVFLQNNEPYPVLGVFPLLDNNPNLWSLNYEVVFYLGFILVWLFPVRAGALLAGLFLLIVAHALGLPISRMVARYACGAFFWLAGLMVAWRTSPAERSGQQSNWPSAALFAYVLWVFAPLRTVCVHWYWVNWAWPGPIPVSPHRLDFIPACTWLLLVVTGRAPQAQRWFGRICVTLAVLGLAGRIWSGDWREVDTVATLVLVIAVALLQRSFSLRPLERLAPLGAVSFGLYIIATPLQLAQRAILPEFSGTPLTFTVRLIALLMVTTATVWLLERKIAPPLARLIRGRKPARSAADK